jgi:hypothetical protein
MESVVQPSISLPVSEIIIIVSSRLFFLSIQFARFVATKNKG